MAAALFEEFKTPIGAPKSLEQILLISGGGGVFDVVAGDDLIFSKKKAGRFPEPDEIIRVLKKRQ